MERYTHTAILYTAHFYVDKFNNYLRVTGGVIGGATCNRAVKPTDVHPISKDTPLIYLVSLEDTNKNDWLYLVLMDVVSIATAAFVAVMPGYYLLYIILVDWEPQCFSQQHICTWPALRLPL